MLQIFFFFFFDCSKLSANYRRGLEKHNKKRAKPLREEKKSVSLWQEDLVLLWTVTACQSQTALGRCQPFPEFNSSPHLKHPRDRERESWWGKGCSMIDGLKHLTVIETENESTLFISEKFNLILNKKKRDKHGDLSWMQIHASSARLGLTHSKCAVWIVYYLIAMNSEVNSWNFARLMLKCISTQYVVIMMQGYFFQIKTFVILP